MENNTGQNNSDSPANLLAGIAQFTTKFISQVESGEGMGLNDEQKAQLKEKLKDSETQKGLNDLKENLNKLKNTKI